MPRQASYIQIWTLKRVYVQGVVSTNVFRGEVKHAYSRYIINNYSIISLEKRWIKMFWPWAKRGLPELIKKKFRWIFKRNKIGTLSVTVGTAAGEEKVEELISNGDPYYAIFLPKCTGLVSGFYIFRFLASV